MSSPPSTNLGSSDHVQLEIEKNDKLASSEVGTGVQQSDEGRRSDVGIQGQDVDGGISSGEAQASDITVKSTERSAGDAKEDFIQAAEVPATGVQREDGSAEASSHEGQRMRSADGTDAEGSGIPSEDKFAAPRTDSSEPTDSPQKGEQATNAAETTSPLVSATTETPETSATPTNVPTAQSDIPTSSFVRVNSPAAGSSSSIFSSAPKKFSTVNINKKFLGKTSASPVAGAAPPNVLGAKPTGALGSLIRPSISPNPSSTSTPKLTSAKLTSVISSKPGTGLLSSAPAVGWAKPSPRPSPGLSPSNDHSMLSSPASATEILRPTPSALGSLKRGQLTTPSTGLGMGMGSKMKKEWAPIASGEGFRSGLGREFPTAGEVIEGQRQAQSQAQSIAQARAAHNAALIEGLDSFRGVNRDPKMHYWDEDDDENAVDDVIDFGDGRAYNIAAISNPAAPPSDTKELEKIQEGPVSKDERFAEDFDRSWPPRGPPTMNNQASKALYNDRSNRFEEHASKIQNQAVPRPQQILSRQPRRSSFDQPGPAVELDQNRAQALHLRDGSRPLPPHLAGRGSERPPAMSSRDAERPPANMAGSLRSLQHDLPPHLRDGPPRPPHTQPGVASRPERHFPPHLDHGSESERAPRPDRWATRERENVLNPEITTPDSGRPRIQQVPSAAAAMGNDHANVDARSSPVHSPKAITNVPSTSEVAPISTGGDVTVAQKDEMHEAAERARLRRQQEESEREARAERARQKAKQLEDKMKESEAAKAAVAPAPITTSPIISKILPRPIDAASQTAGTSQPLPPGLRPVDTANVNARPGQVSVGDLRRAEYSDVWRRGAQPQPVSNGLSEIARTPATQRLSPTLPKRPFDTQKDAKPVDAARNIRERPPHPMIPSIALDQSSGGAPVTVQFADFGKDEGSRSPVRSVSRAMPFGDGEAEGSRFGKRLNDAGTWRKSSTTPAQARTGPEPDLSSVARGGERSSAVSAYQPGVSSASDFTIQAAESPSQAVDAGTTIGEKVRRSSRPAESENNFDEIMARIKSAIVAENSAATHARDVPSTQAPVPAREEQPSGPGHPADPTPASPVRTTRRIISEEARKPPLPVRYIPLPLPGDFSTTTAPLPSEPAPAWKTYVIRLPKSRKPQRPLSRKRTRSDYIAPVPLGWALSWNPPFEQLNPNTLSRDDWLLPPNYIRGKAAAPVSLPQGVFKPFVAPPAAPVNWNRQESEEAVPVVKESSQTVSLEESRAQESVVRKIVVNLPRRSHGSAVARSASAASIAYPYKDGKVQEYLSMVPVEAVQTTEDLDSLLASPTPSEIPLPASSSRDRNAARATPNRRLPDGTGVIFARPHGSSFSEDAEAKSSMRFMVSSELEIDNLLEEVNNMSMDGLTETIPESSNSTIRKQEEPTSHRGQNIARSQATSPNTAASAAWAKSMTYPTSQANQNLSNRDHIKNVWSQAGNDNLQQQSGNSLIGIVDDLPPSLSVSMHDLKEESDKQDRRQTQLDAESPRFATVGAVRSESFDRMPYGRLQPAATGESDSTDAHVYGSVSQMPNGTSYGYPLTNDTPSPNLRHAGHLRSSFSGQHSLSNGVTSTPSVSGLPGQHRGQHGVWVPLNQAGMSSSSGMTAAMNGYMGMPVSPVYGSAAPLQKGNGRSSHNGYPGTAQTSGGMYSHPTGPLDSPSMSYMRPALPINNSYQAAGPQSAYPASTQSYSMRDGYTNYGMNGNGMRQSGTGPTGPGHSRYASMGSMRSGGHGSNNYGQSNYTDQAPARGLGMSGGYNGMNGMSMPGSSRALGGSPNTGRLGSGGISASGAGKRPW